MKKIFIILNCWDANMDLKSTELKTKVEGVNDELSCLFRNIMKNLTGMVGGFLNQIMDRFITTPLCAVENFIGSLLGKITGLIDSAISSVMAPIKSLLAGMGAAFSLKLHASGSVHPGISNSLHTPSLSVSFIQVSSQ